MSRAIVLFSSARRDGNTGSLLDDLAARVELDIVDLATQDIAAYDYEHSHRGDDFEPLMQRVLDHDGIIFAAPVYWYSVPAPMKAFLDRVTDYLDLPDLLDQGRRLRGKTGYVLCTSLSEEASPIFLELFRQTFAYLGMTFGGFVHADCRKGYRRELHTAELQAMADRLKAVPALPDLL